VGAGLLPGTWVPQRGVLYRVSCTVRQLDISCAVGLATDAVLTPAYTLQDPDIPVGGGGLYVESGSVSFRQWNITGACGLLGQCRATEGQQCRYTCSAGYSVSRTASLTQTCSAAGTYTEGGVVECAPTPPNLPAGVIFPLPEDSPAGTFLGTINGSAYNTGDTLLWEILPAGNNETERDAFGTPIGVVQGVFGITLCGGELFLAKAGVLNYFVGTRFYILTLRAKVASTPNVFADITVVVNVTSVRRAPFFPVDASGSRRYSRTVNENVPAGTLVGLPVVAAATAVGQIPTYSIVFGNEAGVFSIDSLTGQMAVVLPVLDFEMAPSYQLLVRAEDLSTTPSLSSTVIVDVLIGDINDAPVAASPQILYIAETSVAAGATVGTVMATDQDDLDSVMFAIVGGSTNFVVDTTEGIVTIGSVLPSFSSTANFVEAGTQNRAKFDFLFTATDIKYTPSITTRFKTR
jgi:hypothetical protein